MTRLENIIARIEQGQDVDWQRERLLLGLDIARAGEVFAEEQLQRERVSDDLAVNDDAIKSAFNERPQPAG